MTDIKAGDEVRVFPPRQRRSTSAPDEGYQGTVTKTARVYGTVVFSAGGYERTIEFNLETGTERGSDRQYGYRVRTPEMVEQDLRRAAALALLRAHDIEFRLGRQDRFTLDQIEALAEVVKTWNQED